MHQSSKIPTISDLANLMAIELIWMSRVNLRAMRHNEKSNFESNIFANTNPYVKQV
jgi:hypothetical protein